MRSVPEICRECASEQRGLEYVIPARALLASLHSQASLHWKAEDVVNLAVALVHTCSSYDRTSVWQSLSPFVSLLSPSMDPSQLSQIMWSLQSLPSALSGAKWLDDILRAVTNALEAQRNDRWEERHVSMAVYGFTTLDLTSERTKAFMRAFTHKARQCHVDTGGELLFSALHLLQSMELQTKELVDLYSVLLTKGTSQQPLEHGRSKNSREDPSLTTSRAEVREQFSAFTSLEAEAAINLLYASQSIDTTPQKLQELFYVLYQKLESAENPMDLQQMDLNTRSNLHNSQAFRSVQRRLLETIESPTAPRTVGISLYGLQQLSTDPKHVRELLRVSAQQLTDSSMDLYVQELERALETPKTAAGKLRKQADPSRKQSST